MKILAQGAEAILYQEKDKVIKERFAKKYRIEQLDKVLRKFRTRREAKILDKLTQEGFASAKLVNFSDTSMKITMDFISGKLVKSILTARNQKRYGLEMGELVGQLHELGIIHSDLTTSNLILSDTHQKIHLIDFGLSFFSDKVEDRAVDLFLFERTLASTHYKLYPTIFDYVLEGYQNSFGSAHEVFDRLAAVRKRGRNKQKA